MSRHGERQWGKSAARKSCDMVADAARHGDRPAGGLEERGRAREREETHTHTHTHTQREREKERDTQRQRESERETGDRESRARPLKPPRAHHT
jgi:hypothetical protein